MREFTETLQTIMCVVSNPLELLPASEGTVEEMTCVETFIRKEITCLSPSKRIGFSLSLNKA